MKPLSLTVLLAKIDSKLNLLLAMVSDYETRIPTIVARVKQARQHLEKNYLHALFLDLEWVTRTILRRKALRQRFEHQTLDIYLLNEELKKHLSLQEPATAWERAVQRWRHKLVRSLKALETDFLDLDLVTSEIFIRELKSSVQSARETEQQLKNTFLVPAYSDESRVIQSISLLTERMQRLNSLLLSVPSVPATTLLPELRKRLLEDWNRLVEVMMYLFKEMYRETERKVAVRAVGAKQGLQRLEIQA